jgi:hypothetical protein
MATKMKRRRKRLTANKQRFIACAKQCRGKGGYKSCMRSCLKK